jgi:hypothetical protein
MGRRPEPNDYPPGAPQATDAQKREMGLKPTYDATPAAYRQWRAQR